MRQISVSVQGLVRIHLTSRESARQNLPDAVKSGCKAAGVENQNDDKPVRNHKNQSTERGLQRVDCGAQVLPGVRCPPIVTPHRGSRNSQYERSKPLSELTELCQEILVCQKCILSHARTHAVPGEGPEDADIIFIGEGPGFHEDRQGRPFVGAAGKYLDELLEKVGLGREDVYITNVVKCRPPGNRDPQPEEIQACRSYLDKQIDLIRPRLVVTLGRFSMQRYFPNASISRIHGQPKRVGSVIYYPMFHPAAALHQPRWRPMVEEDILKIPSLLAKLEEVEEDEQETPQARQLSLF
jgi:uracil-DNA glycosylase family 4